MAIKRAILDNMARHSKEGDCEQVLQASSLLKALTRATKAGFVDFQTSSEVEPHKKLGYVDRQILSLLIDRTDIITNAELTKIGRDEGDPRRRQAVDSAIYRIRKAGYEIESVYGVGYKLIRR